MIKSRKLLAKRLLHLKKREKCFLFLTRVEQMYRFLRLPLLFIAMEIGAG